ncbi:hypothetical protein O988_02523 [Pseudogymnoascus sp. VKM F-3808]|nr:hypothetical protein O988_02523 [Pseudogymnoascus sp. VKM F-3808]
MCFTTPDSSTEIPEACRLRQINSDEGEEGSHIRRRSSLERHLANAPPIKPGYTGKKFPHLYKNEFRDSEGKPLFPEAGGPYYEFVSKSYPYEAQNARGHCKNDYRGPHISKGSTRTITNSKKEIVGVAYHSYNPKEYASGAL